MITVAEVEDFVRVDYAAKDIMHNLAHIHRVGELAHRIGEGRPYDPQLLMLGAYLHGVIYCKEDEVRQFLKEKGLSQEDIEKAVQVAWESQKENRPETTEGLLLHDAHLLEGGKTFIIAKSLVTGMARGQTLNQTIRYIEENVLGCFKCYLPEAQKLYEEKEAFAREFLDDLKRNL